MVRCGLEQTFNIDGEGSCAVCYAESRVNYWLARAMVLMNDRRDSCLIGQ